MYRGQPLDGRFEKRDLPCRHLSGGQGLRFYGLLVVVSTMMSSVDMSRLTDGSTAMAGSLWSDCMKRTKKSLHFGMETF